jgi:hypothetical protein
VFVLSLVTVGLFGSVWMVVVGWWIKRASGNGKPFWWSLVYALSIPGAALVGFAGGVVAMMAGGAHAVNQFGAVIGLVMRLVGIVLYILAAFTTKSGMEAQPIDIPLGGVMTFFFAPIYFQYHLYDYSVEGRVGDQLSGFAEAQSPPQV